MNSHIRALLICLLTVSLLGACDKAKDDTPSPPKDGPPLEESLMVPWGPRHLLMVGETTLEDWSALKERPELGEWTSRHSSWSDALNRLEIHRYTSSIIRDVGSRTETSGIEEFELTFAKIGDSDVDTLVGVHFRNADTPGCDWFEKTFEPIPEAKECSVDPMQHSMKQWGAGEKGRNYCISTPNRELPVVVTCANYNHATYVEYQVFLP